jgi:SAM-dependent methyltransferase
MLKMYHRAEANQQAGGNSPEYWEAAWRDGGYDEALRFCEIDPLGPIFEEYARPGTVMLEGGCGRGQYVEYQSRRGVTVVGLDFAREALLELHSRRGHLPLCAGDVASLPFQDGSFDVYYSGGVVEHFEAGAGPALREAWRVLRPNGVLLISVPYISPLRRTVSVVRRRQFRRISRSAIDAPGEQIDRTFFQYAYTRPEFRQMLTETGFEVLRTRGYSLLWGLSDVPLISGLLNRASQGTGSGRSVTISNDIAGEGPASRRESARALLKRLLIGEDDTVPLLGGMVAALRWSCANMMMYVCKRLEETSFSCATETPCSPHLEREVTVSRGVY